MECVARLKCCRANPSMFLLQYRVLYVPLRETQQAMERPDRPFLHDPSIRRARHGHHYMAQKMEFDR